ncbi:MAG: hypothetical protein HKO53_15880 [Gemmatimonadetes bacterium]|nr:hypothetical protein [Gemmatimonadota bacterium]
MQTERRASLALSSICTLALVAFSGCTTDDFPSAPGEAIGFAKAYGIWTPGPYDTCSKEIHDSYSTIGPDGRLYPTWHPANDPATGCSFGHEHGRDPRGSDLYELVGDIPFALANEAMESWDGAMPRHEDHFGHKVEWENDINLNVGEGAGAIIDITCDVMTKLHQGTHSKDAFTNNLHEVVYHIRCNDGTRVHATLMAAIGTAGELESSCDRRSIFVGTPSPPDSRSGGGRRIIPTLDCVEQHVLVAEGQNSNFGQIRESWEISGRIRTASGKTLFSFNPYYQVFNPSRYYDPTVEGLVGRPHWDCQTEVDGRRARGEMCEESAGVMNHDQPGSAFDGAHRMVDINANNVNNEGGAEVWYTDPFGGNGQTTPFPGSVLQFVSSTSNSGFDTHGPTIGRNRPYSGSGVHSPN